jgi:hypothetical protein
MYRVLVEKVGETDYLDDLSVDGKIVLKVALKNRMVER